MVRFNPAVFPELTADDDGSGNKALHIKDLAVAAAQTTAQTSRAAIETDADAIATDVNVMSTALPGTNGEEGTTNVPKTATSTAIVTSTVDGSYYDLAVQPVLTDRQAIAYQRVRIRAAANATANSKWYSSNDGTFRIGPINNGQAINGWVDVAEPAAVDVSYARVV